MPIKQIIFKKGKFFVYSEKEKNTCPICNKSSEKNFCEKCDFPLSYPKLKLHPTNGKNDCLICKANNLNRMGDKCTTCGSGFKGLIIYECEHKDCSYVYGYPFNKCIHCHPPNIFEMPRFKENTALDEKIQEEPQVVDDGSSSKITQYYSPRMNLKPFLSSLNAQLKKFKAKPKAKVSLKEKFKKLCF